MDVSLEGDLDESNLQLVLCEGECFDENVVGTTPLRTLLPQSPTRIASDWVLKKVEELQACVGLSCDGFEEQYKALLVAIEAGCSLALKLASKKERKLRRLK